jgi:hypothetical protein
MANLLKLKRSAVPGRSPGNGDLVLGELALNTFDGKLFFKTDKDGQENILALSNNYNDLINKPSDFSFNIAGDDSTQRTISRGETVKVSGAGGISVVTDSEGNLVVSLNSLAANPLVFSTTGNYRTLTGYQESGNTYNVRVAEFNNNLLRLTLATFTPTLTSSATPGVSLNWDVACTGFTVSVDNPADYTSEYVNDVSSVTATTGTASSLNTFSAGSKSATPAGGVDWTQTFSTDGDSFIRPSATSGITGGSANLLIGYSYYNGSTTVSYGSTSAVTINWATPTNSISMSNLSGNTFLQTYSSTSYTVSYTGITTAGNVSHSVTPTGGSVTNASGSGTFNFTTPIHKDNTATARTLAVTTTFTRPVAVTGSSYTAQLNASDLTLTASFTYPSFWIFTTSTSNPPSNADIVFGSGYEAGVTVLGDQVKIFSATVNNPNSHPRVFWFGVRTAASQPTSFQTGPSSSLLTNTTYTTSSVNLQPDSVPGGYTAEPFSLYGIIIQPGNTYVSIS